ncbi:MAG: hypothetical protein JWO56_1880 [Acidobacteria bacterium]|nr:hypothetical protein [Acidobacteriota bacterium]
MKYIGLVSLLLLAGFAGSAAAQQVTLVNQTSLAIKATLTEASTTSANLRPQETFTFGPGQPKYTLQVASKNVSLSKSFGPEIHYAVFHRTGQVYAITLSANPPK